MAETEVAVAEIHKSVPAPIDLDLQDGADVEYEQFALVIKRPETTIGELFAVVRMWEPLIQESIGAVIYELIQKGVGVNDKDSLTDMNLLQFACKSGAPGFGDPKKSARVVSDLMKLGADVNAKSAWTQMTPLHIAAFFGASTVIPVLATHPKLDIHAPCGAFEGATPLHLAAMAGSVEVVQELLKIGADPTCPDNAGRSAAECSDLVSQQAGNDIQEEVWATITQLLSNAAKEPNRKKAPSRPKQKQAVMQSPSVTKTSGITASTPGAATGESAAVGDRVAVSGGYQGVVRFRGPVSFDKKGDWIGVQLDEPEGKNNGSVAGVVYFRCKTDHGLFVRPKGCKVMSKGRSEMARSTATPGRAASTPNRANLSTPNRGTGATPKVATGSKTRTPSARGGVARTPSSSNKRQQQKGDGFGKGSKVFVNGKLCTVQYIGGIDLAPGMFIGVELPDGTGKNDGSLSGKRYFTVRANHGLFVKPERCTWRGIKVNALL